MQGNHLFLPIAIPGTLTADVHFEFIAPFDLQQVKVSTNCDATTSFILDVGENTTPDTDAYLDGVTVTGHATVNTEYNRTDFVGDQFPHITDGTHIVVTVDYDGGAGTDAANVSILLVFTEG